MHFKSVRRLTYHVVFNNFSRPVARKGYGSIAHEAKPNGLLIYPLDSDLSGE